MSGNMPGISHLADVILRAGAAGKSDPTMDFGEIGEDKGLRLNGFQILVPVKDYLVLDSVGKIRPGERVLVAWVGNDAVVVGRIREASAVV